MKEKIDIHNYKRRLERRLELIIKSDRILKRNKDIILKFQRDCLTNGLSVVRVEKYLYHLYILALMLRKGFDKLTKNEVMEVVEAIERRNWSDRTKYDYKVSLRVFFKWLRGKGDYPEEVKWIKPRLTKRNRLPEEVLTDDEIRGLADKAENPRDKALILSLYESGCRIGELLPLKIKNIQPNSYGMALIVNGKTGSRRVLIISSAPALANWLTIHPFKNDPEAFVWIDTGTRNRYGMMGYGAVNMMLRNLAKKAGVKKRVNPHSFRHARATHLASILTEAQMKELFSWVQSSDMAATYVHLSGRDVDNALLKIHGLVKEENKGEEVLKVKLCPRCQEKNDPIARFCRRCASPLDIKIVMETEERMKRKDDVVAKVIERVVGKLNLERVVYEAIKELKVEKEFED